MTVNFAKRFEKSLSGCSDRVVTISGPVAKCILVSDIIINKVNIFHIDRLKKKKEKGGTGQGDQNYDLSPRQQMEFCSYSSSIDRDDEEYNNTSNNTTSSNNINNNSNNVSNKTSNYMSTKSQNYDVSPRGININTPRILPPIFPLEHTIATRKGQNYDQPLLTTRSGHSSGTSSHPSENKMRDTIISRDNNTQSSYNDINSIQSRLSMVAPTVSAAVVSTCVTVSLSISDDLIGTIRITINRFIRTCICNGIHAYTLKYIIFVY